MKERMKKKIKNTAGFSLIEMLVTLMILLLVTSVVAVGVPAASRAYNKVVDAANAQVLMSTAMVRLRDEIGTGSDIVISGTALPSTGTPSTGTGGSGGTSGTGGTGDPSSGGTGDPSGGGTGGTGGSGGTGGVPEAVGRAISYDNSLGVRNRIECCTEATVNDNEVIYIQEYSDFVNGGASGAGASGVDLTKFYHPLVSKSASGEKLYVTYSSVSDNHKGVITFHDMVVKNIHTQQELTQKMEFKVRVLTFIEE